MSEEHIVSLIQTAIWAGAFVICALQISPVLAALSFGRTCRLTSASAAMARSAEATSRPGHAEERLALVETLPC